MKSRNDRYEIRLAKPEDAAQLLKIYECGEYSGHISVLFTRRPDPYVSLMHEGDKVVIPIVTDKENGMIVGMGACMIRKAYINGEVKNVGYLAGLKGLPEYRKRVPYILDVYRFLQEQTKDAVDIYYTTILQENVAAQKMLEKKRKNMPEYRNMGEYTVYCFKTGKAAQTKGYTLEKGRIADLELMRGGSASNFNFSPADACLHGLRAEDIFTLRNEQGKVVGACGVWNQQSYKQYIVTEYTGIYKLLKRAPLKLFGYPSFPRENVPANYGSIALLTVEDDNPRLAEQLVSIVAEKSQKFDFLMLGLMEDHPYAGFMHTFKSIQYRSRAYTVFFDNNSLIPDDRPINLEVGLL